MVAQPPSSSHNAIPALTPEEQRKIKFLKIVCIILGGLIFAALAAMVVGFLSGGKKPEMQAGLQGGSVAVVPQPSGTPAPVVSMPPLPEFDIGIAAGQMVRQVSLDGNRLVLVTEGGTAADGNGSEVIIVDLATGKVASRIKLKPMASTPAGE